MDRVGENFSAAYFFGITASKSPATRAFPEYRSAKRAGSSNPLRFIESLPLVRARGGIGTAVPKTS